MKSCTVKFLLYVFLIFGEKFEVLNIIDVRTGYGERLMQPA